MNIHVPVFDELKKKLVASQVFALWNFWSMISCNYFPLGGKKIKDNKQTTKKSVTEFGFISNELFLKPCLTLAAVNSLSL